MSRKVRNISGITGLFLWLLCLLCVSVVGIGKADADAETKRLESNPSYAEERNALQFVAPAERNVYRPGAILSELRSVGEKDSHKQLRPDIPLLRSNKSDLRAGFYKHSVPTELAKPKPGNDSLEVFSQGPDLDYSTFKHTSQRHTSLACADCHRRTADNSAKPAFPSHSACINCHGNQFFSSPTLCTICHSDVTSAKAPLKTFPANFKERFNVKFDHAQHMTAAVRPKNGCSACHTTGLNRGVALSIPSGLSAHSQCYGCHTPSSKSASGKELASCGVCHDQKNYARTSTNAAAFRASFSHAKHGPRQRLECAACHSLTAGLPQGKQVSSPRPAEHFSVGGGQSCLSCHNGKRSFGGDLAFKDCRRCHSGATFRLPG